MRKAAYVAARGIVAGGKEQSEALDHAARKRIRARTARVLQSLPSTLSKEERTVSITVLTISESGEVTHREK